MDYQPLQQLRNMAPINPAIDDKSHQILMDKMDTFSIHKPFRNPNWKPSRRNKNIKQIVSEASRKEASLLATQTASGISTPAVESAGISTPAIPSISHAAQLAQESAAKGPTITYTNIESAPSLHPSSQRRYCDITGLPAPYTDPKTRLRYHNGEIFGILKTLGPGSAEAYLAARGAHTVLK